MTPFEAAIAAAAAAYDISPTLIASGDRRRRASHARWAAMTLLRERKFSYAHIGSLFGCDHSSVIHGIKALDRIIKFDGPMATLLETARKGMTAPEQQKRRWRPWTEKDEARCLEMGRAGMPLIEIAEKLDRSVAGIHHRLKAAGIIKASTREARRREQLEAYDRPFRDDLRACEEAWAAAGASFENVKEQGLRIAYVERMSDAAREV